LLRRLAVLLGIAACLTGSPLAGEERNPLREEMAGLDLALKGIIEAVVLEDMNRVPPALEKAREGREKRDAAVRAGFSVRLPKNPNRMEEFSILNRKLQIDLLELGRVAETGQKRVVRNHAHRLLDTCVACHEKFRK